MILKKLEINLMSYLDKNTIYSPNINSILFTREMFFLSYNTFLSIKIKNLMEIMVEIKTEQLIVQIMLLNLWLMNKLKYLLIIENI